MGGESKYRKFTDAYRELAVRRLRESEHIHVSELCRELGISRQLLYQWRDRLEREREKLDPAKASQAQLGREVSRLKQALAEKTLEADSFRGAFEKVEALRQSSTGSGVTASGSKSGN